MRCHHLHKRRRLIDFGEYLDYAASSGGLDIISELTDGTDIAKRAAYHSKNGLNALLYTRHRSSEIPLLLNLYGTMDRLEKAWGMSCDAIAEKAYKSIDLKPELEFTEPDKYAKLSGLSCLPLYKFYENDTSGTLSMACIISESDNIYDCGIYRIEPIPENEAVVHCRESSELFRLAESSDSVPVTVAVGCSPYLLYTAACSLPDDVDELRLASCLGSVRWMETEHHPVPSDTHIIIQGRLNGRKALGGQFYNYKKSYCERKMFPVMEIESVRIKPDGVFQSTVIGDPPMENAWLGIAAARLHFYRMKDRYPEIMDISHPAEGVFGLKCVVKCREITPELRDVFKNDCFYSGFSEIEFQSL
ncbi:MAG: UbiD family decarboxylase [Deferribacterales bacterium]